MKRLPSILLSFITLMSLPSLSFAKDGRFTSGDLRIAPHVGVSYGYSREEARLQHVDGAGARELRQQANNRLEIGVGYDYLRVADTLRLRGTSSVGVGMLYFPGDALLHLRQDTALQWVPRSWFGASIGLGASLDCNASRFSHSAIGLAFPVGVRLGLVELEYRPVLQAPLSREKDAVLGGALHKRAAPGVAWLDFVVRVRLPFPRLDRRRVP